MKIILSLLVMLFVAACFAFGVDIVLGIIWIEVMG